MAPTVTTVYGQTFALPAAPPLVPPPLSLLDLASPLIDNEGLSARAAEANEKLASAEAAYLAVEEQSEAEPSRMDILAQLEVERGRRIEAEAWATEAVKRVADLSRWTQGITWLPDPNQAATETWAPDTIIVEANLSRGATNTKNIGLTQGPFAWCDPFQVIGRDARSTMGFSTFSDLADRIARATRALLGHEAKQCELEWWTGTKIPTNFHLSASPNTALTSPHRVLSGTWPNPTPAAGTVLGTAYGLKQSMAALNQSIADFDAGVGMIHATPFAVEMWSAVYPFIRDMARGRIYTVNGNLMVPGYGYPGTGPDPASRTVTDGTTTSGSATLGSATAAFTPSDIGSTVTGTGIPAGAYIIATPTATTATMSANANATGSSLSVVIGAGTASLAGQRYQWAYATEMVYYLRGDVRTYPWDVRQASPLLPQTNQLDVRAERPWALITNQLLRAAVLVDTQTP